MSEGVFSYLFKSHTHIHTHIIESPVVVTDSWVSYILSSPNTSVLVHERKPGRSWRAVEPNIWTGVFSKLDCSGLV